MADQIVSYSLGQNLYLNITNRCTNNCLFCIRHTPRGIGYNLWLKYEPSPEEILAAIKEPASYQEIVFCGYGEPLLRLDTVKKIASHLKKKDAKIRINTNGQAGLIYQKNIVSDLKDLVDIICISLNAHSASSYLKICRPVYGEKAYQAVLDFARSCVGQIPRVILSVVDWPGVDVEKCREIARKLGAEFRLRKFSEN
ncbi:radical SAM protein, TatD family-associated [Desulfofundulus australicus DSM 11792]|uniref:Radical SAM protein, TatD family-associated n=1 Tax=Desulfofundulus australicus DSM 11792 TaxID=1121425 RepID=A0A1M5C6B8_9FIRM|nr:TatD family nuclease-associated radical SAM protein [Desulfofundulus australicus]SHF50308.1 radical SAM protein, TatD family-associated [Desulfofundulus australicus DSM 11792]